ncbi:MAG: phosphoglucomutase [Treponema sp.]|nr:phosphoglucomutase [Treponema sp.]
MILSASGWRKVFAQSGIESDTTTKIGNDNKALSFLAAESFLEWLKARKTESVGKAKKAAPKIVVATDTRPTGKEAANYVLRALALGKAKTIWVGVAAAPEIMAFAKDFDAFVYISASHNPIGHNGIKFGLDDGGVLNGSQNLEVRKIFERKLQETTGAAQVLARAKEADIKKIVAQKAANKKAALASYKAFSRRVISGLEKGKSQDAFFDNLKDELKKNKITVCADFNGSARTLCIDKKFFAQCGTAFKAINDKAGEIVHEIIPEPENLVHVARFVKSVASESKAKKAATVTETSNKAKKAAAASKVCKPQTIIGYMPDCDGDRGNIVYYSKKEGKAKILKAQEVFALSVLSELACAALRQKAAEKKAPSSKKIARLAVAVNCPTSMRIEEIAAAFGAKVFRAEVGEANVVNLAREKRAAGFEVPILGEGSNGGTITYPACVRDPLNTVFALIKILTIKEAWALWTKARGLPFNENYSLDDILDSLPKYTTTGVSESRAILKIKTADHAVLKKNFQKAFERSFKDGADGLVKKHNITSWKASLTNGTKEKLGATDFSKSKKGGLKILFFENNSKKPSSFIWMRGSGTEPVFRIMCDVKGTDAKKERELLAWETKMLAQADKMR